jgi:hypothetical protein
LNRLSPGNDLRVRARWWGFVLVVLLVLCWGGFGYLMTKPTDHHDYRKAAVQAAESAYDSVGTVRLTVEASLDGRTFPPYVTSMMDDAREALAGAAKQFTAKAPPDEQTRTMRDRLGPLLLAANVRLGETEQAVEDGDDQAVREAVDRLHPLGEQLSDFIEAYQ